MLQSIKKELILRKNELQDIAIKSIYFGGGTPSLLSINEIQTIFDVIYSNYKVNANVEITLEANPDDLSVQKIKALANSPINRLSIGIQSFFEDDLKFMNRAHTAEESKICLSESLQFFKNITIDLIYGVPNMTLEKWNQNLQLAFDFKVPHISSYALTVEEKTALANFIKKGKIPNIDDELALNHFNLLVSETEKQGFVQYEISNFGKPNYFSKHNISYWQREKYLGIGPSAHSFDGFKRSWNISNNVKYIKSIQDRVLPLEIENLSKNDCFNETIMTGLRTIWGVSLHKIETEFGFEILENLLKNAQPFIDVNLLKIKRDDVLGNILITTQKGKFLADGIASDLFII